MKTSENKSESKSKAPAGKASPTAATKATKAAKTTKAKPEAATTKTVKAKAAKAALPKKAPGGKTALPKKAPGGKKGAAGKVATKRAAAGATAKPLVPAFDREDVAHAAYFKYQKRVYFGHSPDPLADWYAAEAELLSAIEGD